MSFRFYIYNDSKQGKVPVFFNSNEVDDRSATGHDQDVEDTREPVNVYKDKEGTETLKHPVDKVELHGDKVSVPAVLLGIVT